MIFSDLDDGEEELVDIKPGCLMNVFRHILNPIILIRKSLTIMFGCKCALNTEKMSRTHMRVRYDKQMRSC